MSRSVPIPENLEVRAYEDQDFTAMQSLFTSVFNESMSKAFHAWKYRPGKSGAVVVMKDNELIGHYGGVGAEIMMKGQAARAIQIVDVMIKPAARVAVRTHSPFFLAGSRFLESYIGYEQPYLLGYGFPSDRHLRLAQRLGLYAPVGSMLQLEWEPEGLGSGIGLLQRITELTRENISRYQKALDHLWSRMLGKFTNQYLVCRDSGFIRWRYLEHPEKHYRVLIMQSRFTNKVTGLVVLRDMPDHTLLMDVIGQPEDFSAMLKLALHESRRLDSKPLRTWCSESWVDLFPHASAQQQKLPITTPANIWTAGPAPETIQGHWWLMPGDTDFL